MSASRITTGDEDRLDNVHPGDILREDFLIGDAIAIEDVVAGSGIEEATVRSLLKGQAPITADLALRLGRYFDLPETFFLGLQNDYDLEESRRRLGGELDRIVPRAA